MHRFVPRALLTASLAVAVGCATAYEPPPAPDPEAPGARFRVLVPNFQVEDGVAARAGQTAANAFRDQVAEMATHTSVPASEMRQAIRHFGVTEMDAVDAVQLADQMNAQVATFGTIRQENGQLLARVQVTDVQSGESFELDNVRAGDPATLGTEVYSAFENTVQGIRMAALCVDFLGSEQWERALSNCEQALEIVPEAEGALYGRATALVNMGQYEESLATYERLLQINPEHENALLGAGLAASHLGQTRQASQYYQDYLALNPDETRVRIRVASDIAATGDHISAFQVLEPAIEESREDVEFMEYLGQLATSAGLRAREQDMEADAQQYFRTALEALEAVYEQRGDEVEGTTIRRMADVYRETGRDDEGLRLLERATQTHGDDAAIWSTYGRELSRVERHRDAIQAFSRAIDLDPDIEQIHLRRAIARIDAGERQAARQDLAQAAQRGDRDQVAQFVYSRGARALQAENFSDAADLLSVAHEYASGTLRSDISFQWGVALFRQGQRLAERNTAGAAGPARQALDFFRQALPRFEASQHAQASQLRSATQQFIDNQEAIIRAAGRR